MSIWDHYLELITDPAHTLVESTFILAEFVIFSIIAVRLKKAWFKMLDLWHRRIDDEHGHSHIKTTEEILNSVLYPRKNKRPKRYKGEHRAQKVYDGEADGYVWRLPS